MSAKGVDYVGNEGLHPGDIYIEPLILNQNSKHTRVNRYEDFIMWVGGPTQNPLQCLADSSLVHDQLGHLQTA